MTHGSDLLPRWPADNQHVRERPVLAQLGDVWFGFPGTDLFTGLTWQINPGARVGLVGPNGCGKSTLLRLIDGRLQPDEGTVARARGLSLAYLKQSQEFEGQGLIFDA